jgi:hypothetical protein
VLSKVAWHRQQWRRLLSVPRVVVPVGQCSAAHQCTRRRTIEIAPGPIKSHCTYPLCTHAPAVAYRIARDAYTPYSRSARVHAPSAPPRVMRATGRLRGLVHALGAAVGNREKQPQDVITAPPAEDVSDVEDDGSGLPVIPWGEIMQHRFLADIWVVVDGYVYDMTEFISSDTHPGGEEIPLQ